VFFAAVYALPLYAEYFKELVIEGLRFPFFVSGILPVFGKGGGPDTYVEKMEVVNIM